MSHLFRSFPDFVNRVLLAAVGVSIAGCENKTPSQQQQQLESEPELRLYSSWFRPASNTGYVYLQNTGEKPITLDGLDIQGYEESAKIWPLDPERKTNWFDFLPEKIAPGLIVLQKRAFV
ncbi:MAG: hypothetical protein ACK5LK_11935 [Chthoniobacterales bacterium]